MSSPFFQNLLAIYTTTQLTPNTTATFNCAANFTVVGELSAVCSSTGQWVAADGTIVPTTTGGVPNPSCMAVPAAVSNLLASAAAVNKRDVLVCDGGKQAIAMSVFFLQTGFVTLWRQTLRGGKSLSGDLLN